MPFKHNAARRHRIPRARYRVTNWPALRDRAEASRRSHAVAGRGGCDGLVGAEAKYARRAADLLRSGDRTRAVAAPRLPPGPAPGRGIRPQHLAPARAWS